MGALLYDRVLGSTNHRESAGYIEQPCSLLTVSHPAGLPPP